MSDETATMPTYAAPGVPPTIPLDDDEPSAGELESSETTPLTSIRDRLKQQVQVKTEAWEVPGRPGIALLFTPSNVKSEHIRRFNTLAGKGQKKGEVDEAKLAALIIGQYADCLLENGAEVMRSDLSDDAPQERADFGSIELLELLEATAGGRPSRARGVRALFGDNEPGMIAMSRALLKASGIMDDPDTAEAAGPTDEP